MRFEMVAKLLKKVQFFHQYLSIGLTFILQKMTKKLLFLESSGTKNLQKSDNILEDPGKYEYKVQKLEKALGKIPEILRK